MEPPPCSEVVGSGALAAFDDCLSCFTALALSLLLLLGTASLILTRARVAPRIARSQVRSSGLECPCCGCGRPAQCPSATLAECGVFLLSRSRFAGVCVNEQTDDTRGHKPHARRRHTQTRARRRLNSRRAQRSAARHRGRHAAGRGDSCLSPRRRRRGRRVAVRRGVPALARQASERVSVRVRVLSASDAWSRLHACV